MDDQPSCGKGVASNAGLPAALGAVAGALGAVLVAHQASLDVSDSDAKREHDAYQEHPLHHEFLERFEASWLRVQVYDLHV